MGKGTDPGDNVSGRVQVSDSQTPLQVVPGYNFVGPGDTTAGVTGPKGGFSTGGWQDNNSSPANHVEPQSPNTAGPRGAKGNKSGTRRA
jgi:hypothetical protein